MFSSIPSHNTKLNILYTHFTTIKDATTRISRKKFIIVLNISYRYVDSAGWRMYSGARQTGIWTDKKVLIKATVMKILNFFGGSFLSY